MVYVVHISKKPCQKLDHFARLIPVFDQLGYKKDFLALPVETWNDNNSFKEMNNYVTNLLVINDAGTIHKKTMCSRQKYPTYLTRSANTEFSTDFKYGGSSFFIQRPPNGLHFSF